MAVLTRPSPHEVPAATQLLSLLTWDSVLAAVTAPESWAQLPVLQAGTQLRGSPAHKARGAEHPHASPSPGPAASRGCGSLSWAQASGQVPLAQRAPAVQRERSGLCPWHPAPSPHRPLSPSLLLGQCQILTQLCLRTRPKSLCLCSASTSRPCWQTHRALSGTGTLLCNQVCAQARFLCPALPSEFWSMIP